MQMYLYILIHMIIGCPSQIYQLMRVARMFWGGFFFNSHDILEIKYLWCVACIVEQTDYCIVFLEIIVFVNHERGLYQTYLIVV
jgi:hypothetical protein